MLKTLDILLGLSVVMLIANMAVTVLTQFATSILNSRGKYLLRGLRNLLQQINPTLEDEIAEEICSAILKHPMISHNPKELGSTIHREEFTKLLMDIAAQDKPQNLSANAIIILRDLLKDNGIENPEATMDKVRNYALELEISKPELAANVRHSMALMQEANSRLVAKINSWFDQTIDRVSEHFTLHAQFISLICSLLVVTALQLDTVDIINRLSVDDQLRNSLVSEAIKLNDQQLNAKDSPLKPSCKMGYRLCKIWVWSTS